MRDRPIGGWIAAGCRRDLDRAVRDARAAPASPSSGSVTRGMDRSWLGGSRSATSVVSLPLQAASRSVRRPRHKVPRWSIAAPSSLFGRGPAATAGRAQPLAPAWASSGCAPGAIVPIVFGGTRASRSAHPDAHPAGSRATDLAAGHRSRVPSRTTPPRMRGCRAPGDRCAVAAAHRATEAAPGMRKHWRWLTHAFR
jgi:hypothetical protein